MKMVAALLLVFVLPGGLLGCARYLPAPGGGETVNEQFYGTKDDLLEHLSLVKQGMSEEAVFASLGRQREDLTRLSREEILTALLGTSNVEFRDSFQDQDGARLLQALTGYRLNYRVVGRKVGFASPVRIRTDEKGFSYAVTFLFRDGVLYKSPIMAGGDVNTSKSTTFFDYLNPGMVLNRTGY